MKACLKIHPHHLHALLRGISGSNSRNIAHYVAFIFPTFLNATVMNVYLSILLEQLANWRYKPGIVLKNAD